MRATAILVGDMHLRGDQPKCRIDDYQDAQLKKLRFLNKLQTTHGCPVLCAGDVFHKQRTEQRTELLAITEFPEQFYSVVGNHDRKKGFDMEETSFGVMVGGGVIRPITYGPLEEFNIAGLDWDVAAIDPKKKFKKALPAICVQHVETWHKENPYHDDDIGDASDLLKKSKFDVLLTGDNHQQFSIKRKGKHLVNPGSFMRMTANQMDHTPAVVLWYPEREEPLEWVYLPIENDVISREHIEQAAQSDKRIEKFLDSLGDRTIQGLDFEKTVNTLCADVSDDIKREVEECLIAQS